MPAPQQSFTLNTPAHIYTYEHKAWYTCSAMKQIKIIIVLGALVVLTPFSGLPSSWKTLSLVVLGSTIVLLAFWLFSLGRERPGRHETSHTVQTPQETVSEETSGEGQAQEDEEHHG